MTHDDDERIDADEKENEDVFAEEIEEGDLEDVSGGLRMNPVSASLGKSGRLGGVTVQPSGATVTFPANTAGRNRKGF
jgi:hypothetical protein